MFLIDLGEIHPFFFTKLRRFRRPNGVFISKIIAIEWKIILITALGIRKAQSGPKGRSEAKPGEARPAPGLEVCFFF
ncbi:hypothetical protein AB3N59_14820 [Leptospira sp. WS92.C1]